MKENQLNQMIKQELYLT